MGSSKLFLCFLILMVSCDMYVSKEQNVVATVGDRQLNLNDLSAVLPDGVIGEDSAAIADEYVMSWVREQLIVLKAQNNLSRDRLNLEKEVQEYKNSLLKFRYQQEMLRQRMDTTVTDTELKEYYDSHSDLFVLDQDVVKGIYIELPVSVGKNDLLKEMMASKDEATLKELELFGIQFAKKLNIATEDWIPLEKILDRLPKENDLFVGNIKLDKIYQIDQDEMSYLLIINDLRKNNQKAPYEFVRERIENLILNSRKLEFIRNLEAQIYEEALDNNAFSIYR